MLNEINTSNTAGQTGISGEIYEGTHQIIGINLSGSHKSLIYTWLCKSIGPPYIGFGANFAININVTNSELLNRNKNIDLYFCTLPYINVFEKKNMHKLDFQIKRNIFARLWLAARSNMFLTKAFYCYENCTGKPSVEFNMKHFEHALHVFILYNKPNGNAEGKRLRVSKTSPSHF